MTHMSIKQVAERWNVRVQQVLAHVKSGDLHAIDISRPNSRRPTWRITQDAIERFERARSTAPAPAPAPTRRHKSTSAPKEFF